MSDTLTLLQLIKNGELGSGGSGYSDDGFADFVALRYSDLAKDKIPVYEFKLFINNKEIDPTADQRYNNAGCIPYWFNIVYAGIENGVQKYILQTSLYDDVYSSTDNLMITLWDKNHSSLGNLTINFNDKDHAIYQEYAINTYSSVRLWSLIIGPTTEENIQAVAAISAEAHLIREEE